MKERVTTMIAKTVVPWRWGVKRAEKRFDQGDSLVTNLWSYISLKKR